MTYLGDEAAAVAALARAGVDAQNASQNGTRAVRFSADDPSRTNPAVLRELLDAGIGVLTLAREERTLEDAYFAIVAQARQK